VPRGLGAAACLRALANGERLGGLLIAREPHQYETRAGAKRTEHN
jgi:hypothetical protein